MTRLNVPVPDNEFAVPVAGEGAILVRHHRCLGQAKASLLLCHGNGFAIDAYAPFWAPLTAEFDLFAFDLRHHGRNEPAAEWLTGFETFAGDYDRIVLAVRAAAPGQPLLGALHSISAITAIFQAAQGGPTPDGLILFDPPMQPPPGHPNHALAHGFELKLAEWAQARPRSFDDPGDLAAGFAKSRSLSGWVEGAHDLMARSILKPDDAGRWTLRCPPEAEAANYLANADLTTWDLFDRISVPMAFISGDPGHPAGQSPAKVCAALHQERGYPLISVPGTTHMLQIEQPQACREALAALLPTLA